MLSPIVVVPKKNGKIIVCVNYQKLNSASVTYAFPLPFTGGVLNAVASYEIYNFLDGFSGYNEVKMHLDDQENLDRFCHRMGRVCGCGNDVRLEDRTDYISKSDSGDLHRLYTGIYAGIC